MTPITWTNGALSCSAISMLDRGFQYGDGLFETMRAIGGRMCLLKEHVARMLQGLTILRIASSDIEARVREGIGAVLGELRGTEVAYVKAIVTRGVGPAGPTMQGDFLPSVVVIAAPDTRPRGTAARAITSTVVRNEQSPLTLVKSLNFAEMLLARAEAEDAGVEEALMLNTQGHICEASVANVFAVRSGALVTPDDEEGCLPGIVRAVVCDEARQLGMEVWMGTLSREELAGAEEAFITNSGIGVAPLVELDGTPIAGGFPGERTLALAKRFAEREEESAESVQKAQTRDPALDDE